MELEGLPMTGLRVIQLTEPNRPKLMTLSQKKLK